MNTMCTLPTTAQKREMALAELRVERMRLQLLVTEVDFIGAGVQAGLIWKSRPCRPLSVVAKADLDRAQQALTVALLAEPRDRAAIAEAAEHVRRCERVALALDRDGR